MSETANDTQKKVTVKKVTKIRPIQHIKPSQWNETAQVRQHWTVTAKPGQTLKDIMMPRAWATLAPQIEPWAIIQVIAEDGSFFAELFVTACSTQWVQTVLVKNIKLTKQAKDGDEEDEEHITKWRGALSKWCVVRAMDNSNVVEKCLTKEDAEDAKRQYEKALKL